MSPFKTIYDQMFAAKQAKDTALADRLMKELERLRAEANAKPQVSEMQKIFSDLPEFARYVLGKSNTELGRKEDSNCINAALNFFSATAHWPGYSTGKLLSSLQRECVQLASREDFRFGDLAVSWSRTGGTWDDKPIEVSKINGADPDFPYGLVFDHVMVRVSEDLVFHKADPTGSSRYEIDYLESAIITTLANRGFELTFHRRATGA